MADEVIELNGVRYTYSRIDETTATVTAVAMDGQANTGGVVSIPYDAARAMFSGLRAAWNYRRITARVKSTPSEVKDDAAPAKSD